MIIVSFFYHFLHTKAFIVSYFFLSLRKIKNIP